MTSDRNIDLYPTPEYHEKRDEAAAKYAKQEFPLNNVLGPGVKAAFNLGADTSETFFSLWAKLIAAVHAGRQWALKEQEENGE